MKSSRLFRKEERGGNVAVQLPPGFGPDEVNKIQSSKILIIGLNSTGAEIGRRLTDYWPNFKL